MQGVTSASVKFDKPFERLNSARHAGSKFVEQFPDDFVLSGVDHGQSGLFQDFHGFFAIPGLQQRFDDFLHGPKIFLVGFEDTMRKSRSLIPIGIFYIEIEQKFSLLAALFKIRGLFQQLRGFGEIAL